MRIELVSMDPSLRNWGIVTAVLESDTGEIKVTGMNLIETTEAVSAKKGVRQNSQDINSAILLCEGVEQACMDVSIAFAEVPVGSQSARAMASYGICVGVLGSVKIPLIQVTPTEVKKASVGIATATKEEMIQWAVAKHPEAPWLRVKSTGKLLGKNEHLADAVAAIYAGMQTAEFKSALKILQSMTK